MFKRIKQLRKNNNYTQNDIAKILDISRPLYSLYENGKKDIPLKLLQKLARFYNTSIDYLVEDTNEIIPFKKTTL